MHKINNVNPHMDKFSSLAVDTILLLSLLYSFGGAHPKTVNWHWLSLVFLFFFNFKIDNWFFRFWLLVFRFWQKFEIGK